MEGPFSRQHLFESFSNPVISLGFYGAGGHSTGIASMPMPTDSLSSADQGELCGVEIGGVEIGNPPHCRPVADTDRAAFAADGAVLLECPEHAVDVDAGQPGRVGDL